MRSSASGDVLLHARIDREVLREIIRDELAHLAPRPAPGVERRLFDYAGAAAYLSVSIRIMKQLGGPNGVIAQVKIGGLVRFDKADLDAYVDHKRAALM